MPGPLTAADIARLVDIYASAETELLERIAKRLAKGITFEGWTERKYAETLAMRRELEQSLARATAMGPQAIDSVLTDSWRQGRSDAAMQVANQGVTGQLARTNTSGLRALVGETVTAMNSANAAILRTSLDAYRSTIADVSTQVVSGQSTRLQATQKALDKLAEKGITGFTDRTGRAWSIDSYAEMAVRTADGRAYLGGKIDTFSAAGIHEYVVSRSGSPCPLCGPWEGRVVSEGPSKYPTVGEARAAGLFHPNCGHTLDAFTPGTEKLLGVRPNGPSQAEVEEQRKRYAQSQQQRALERNVRKAKLDQAAAITPQARQKANAQVAQAQADLRAHTARTGARRQYAREKPMVGKGLAPVTKSAPPSPAKLPTAHKPAAPTIEPHPIELSDREFVAFRDYGEHGYQRLNPELRGLPIPAEAGKPPGVKYGIKTNKQQIDLMDGAMVRSGGLDRDLTLYRGSPTVAGYNAANVHTAVGSVIRDPAYLSTSESKAVADQFGHDSIRLRITAPKGTSGLEMNAHASAGLGPPTLHPKEKEILLARGTGIRVDKVVKLPNGITEVWGTVVP
jgi:hypothetical protein